MVDPFYYPVAIARGQHLIVSHSKRFILLAPWKTASQTCHASLAAYNDSPYDRFFHFNPALGRVVHQHVTLADLAAMPEGGLDYTLAAFVRNPYDRAYSGFIQIQRDFEFQTRLQVEPQWVGDLVRAQISDNMGRVIAAQFDFDAWIAALPDYEVFECGRNTNMPLHPAHYWTQCGNRKVHFVGKVEHFEQDFAAFCALIGIAVPAIQIENTSEEGQIRTNCYSRYANRMSRKALDRINDLFARDFELFGYERL